jgi:hypothetical protein
VGALAHASGQPVDLIATRRPNDPPGTDFYYRLIPVQGVIVHKTHITYPMGPQKLKRVKQLFYSGDWHAAALPGYGPRHRANPFETFEAIPAVARYQFMLDNAEYFVRTFIRGPVCRGQIATDVIRDNFWALFQEPATTSTSPMPYRGEATPLLAMPGQIDDVGSVLSLWHAYRDKRNEYEALRRDSLCRHAGAELVDLWAGNDNALLSIFRHFDSASVTKGLIGDVPLTMWLFDYPLFERTYYQLAVNFDVFGNVSHQLQTRLYFDLIRNGAEVNFLRLMPANQRGDPRRLVPEQRQGEDVDGLRGHRHRHPERPQARPHDPKRDLAQVAAAHRQPECRARPDQPLPGRLLLAAADERGVPQCRAVAQPPGVAPGGRAEGDRPVARGDHAAHRRAGRPAPGLQPAAQPRAQQRGVPAGRGVPLSRGWTR